MVHHLAVEAVASAEAEVVASFHYVLGNNTYPVTIVRKNNKNTYIRVNDDLNIVVTTNYFVSQKVIEDLIEKNNDYIIKMINKKQNRINKKREIDDYNINVFGTKYRVVYSDSFSETEIINNMIYTKDKKELNKYLSKYINNIINNRLDNWYDVFEEEIPRPNLKLRRMKSRWGVCNRNNNNVTLNLELINYNVECLDYVIVHELSHFIHPNHSRNFYLLVEKYYPNYKQARKILKE